MSKLSQMLGLPFELPDAPLPDYTPVPGGVPCITDHFKWMTEHAKWRDEVTRICLENDHEVWWIHDELLISPKEAKA